MFEKTKEFGLSQKIRENNIDKNVWTSVSLTDSHMKCDTGLDSGLGSLKSAPTITVDVTTHEEGNQSPFIDNCSDAALLNLLTISERNDSWKVEEPPHKISRMDDFSESTQCHSQASSDSHLMSFSNTQNCQEDTSHGYLWTRDSLLSDKENQQLRTFTSLNPTLVSEEATLGDYTSQDASRNLHHMQSVLRALIREVGQTAAQEILAKDEHDFLPTTAISRESECKSSSSSAVNATSLPQPSSVRSLTTTSKRETTKRPTLCTNYPSRSKDGKRELRILSQPEEQHRARYLTEGSRGAVKDREGTGFPEVKLFGCNKQSKLQVFIATDQGKIQPHLFYQASKVCGKNSSSCIQRKIDGTVILEVDILPEKDMTVSCDFVGILKERNVDVEQRLLQYGGTRNKKRSTRCRLIFRSCIPIQDNCVEILQVASMPILCTQPPGVPEVSKKSLSSCSVKGGIEMFIIGKNFLKDTKVIFKEVESGCSVVKENGSWEVAIQPDKEYLQPTHLVCPVPSYRDQKITAATVVQLIVKSGGKTSDPQPFTYTPIIPAVNEEWMKMMTQDKAHQGLHKSSVNTEPFSQEVLTSVIQLPVVTPSVGSVPSLHQSVSPCVIVIPGSNSALLASNSLPPTSRVISTAAGDSYTCNTNNIGTSQVQLVVMPHAENNVCSFVQNNQMQVNESPQCLSPSSSTDNHYTPQDKLNASKHLETVLSQPFTEEINIDSSVNDAVFKNVWASDLKTNHLPQYSETTPMDTAEKLCHLPQSLSSSVESRCNTSQEIIDKNSSAEDSVCNPSSSMAQKDVLMQDFNLAPRLNVHVNSTSCDSDPNFKNQNLTTNTDLNAQSSASKLLQQDEENGFPGVEHLENCNQPFPYYCTEQSTPSLPDGNIKRIGSILNDQYKVNSVSDVSDVLQNDPRKIFSNSTSSTYLNGVDELKENSESLQNELRSMAFSDTTSPTYLGGVDKHKEDSESLQNELRSMTFSSSTSSNCINRVNEHKGDSNTLQNELKGMAFSSSTSSAYINGVDDHKKESIAQLSPAGTTSAMLITDGYSSELVDICQVASSQTVEATAVDDISAVSWIPDSELLQMINSSTFDNV